MIRLMKKRTTDEEGFAVLLTKESVGEVLAHTGGFQVEEIDPIDPEKRFVAVLYDTPVGRKRVSEGQYLVEFKGEMFAVPLAQFASRFEFVR